MALSRKRARGTFLLFFLAADNAPSSADGRGEPQWRSGFQSLVFFAKSASRKCPQFGYIVAQRMEINDPRGGRLILDGGYRRNTQG